MTDKERLRAIEAVFSSTTSPAKAMLAVQDILDAAPKISVAQPEPTKMPEWMERQFDNAEKTVASWPESKRIAAGIAQPYPHPLGSVRFDEATEEDMRRYWEPLGFEPFGPGAKDEPACWFQVFRQLKNGRGIGVQNNGELLYTYWELEYPLGPVPPVTTFQEAKEFLDKMAELLGGWA
jgi:hypothetical protein